MTTLQIHYTLNPKLNINDQSYDLEPALRLLNGIQKQGNLRAAAGTCGYSYRKAWDILKQLENLCGSSLVIMHRGRGSQLSELGQSLLDISEENDRLFNANLTAAAEKASTSLHEILSNPRPLRIVASDSEKLNTLRTQHHAVELHIDGSISALAAYAEGKCEMAGFHIASGENTPEKLENYCRYLTPKNDRFILLEQRQQGFISHPEKPINTLQQIIEQQLLFVNRQSGSGTRILLDRLLQEQNLKPGQLNGYYHEEHTHLAVATMIASRHSDAGLGIKSVAESLKLHFSPVKFEYYFLVFKSLPAKTQQLINSLDDQQTMQIMNYNTFLKAIEKTPT